MIRLVSAWVLVNGLLMTPVWLSGAVTDARPRHGYHWRLP